VTAPETCEFVFALMFAARLDEAFRILVFAVVILVFAVLIFVFAVASVEPRLLDAARTFVFVVPTLVPTAANVAPSELDAFVTSDCTASEPDDRPAPVSVLPAKLHTCEAVKLDPPDTPFAKALPIVPALVRVLVATFQTADTRVPKVSRERPLTAQTAVGMVEAREVEAVRTVASV